MKSRTSAVFLKEDRSVGQWTHILNYYSAQHDNLTEEEIIEIYDESEKCRNEFNSKHSNRFNKFKEDEVSTDLYPRAKRILKERSNNPVTSSHSIAN